MHSSHSKVFVVLALSTLVVLASCKKTEPGQQETKTMKTSFVDLMKLGKNYACTFTRTTKNSITNGTVYIEARGKNVRADFTSTFDNKTIDSHMIRTGNVGYFWNSSMPQGMKMTIDREDQAWFGNTEGRKNMDMRETDPLDMSCEPWSTDSSMFEPPSDITFTDMAEQLKSMKKQMESMKTMMEEKKMGIPGKNCGICDNMPSATAKDECKKAMGC